MLLCMHACMHACMHVSYVYIYTHTSVYLIHVCMYICLSYPCMYMYTTKIAPLSGEPGNRAIQENTSSALAGGGGFLSGEDRAQGR